MANFKDNTFWKDDDLSKTQTKVKLNLKPNRLWLLATGSWNEPGEWKDIKDFNDKK